MGSEEEWSKGSQKVRLEECCGSLVEIELASGDVGRIYFRL